MIEIKLINQEKSSEKDVVQELLDQKSGTAWAEESNQWSIDYVKQLTSVYGDVWYEGLLSQDDLTSILLPAHANHRDALSNENKTVIFPLDTPLGQAVEIYKNRDSDYDAECSDNIEYLKSEIKKKGFTSTITLVIINDTLKHVDGLHRLLAIGEGYEYKPVPVYLCDDTK